MAIKETTGLYALAREKMIRYGEKVVSDRALPDFRDGLKPVQRRILWAARTQAPNNGAPKKSASVIGETLGKYHPHGDQSIYSAMTTMVHMPYPLILPQGNFGNPFIDSKAGAPRYTECKLSKLATLMYLDSDYLAITPMHDNYDGEHKEPLFLPATVPAIFLNSIFGIAVGVTGNYPSFTFKSVIEAVQHILDNGSLKLKVASKMLTLYSRYGGICISSKAEIAAMLTSRNSSLQFRPDYKIDEGSRTVTFTGLPSGFDYNRMVKMSAEHKHWSTLIERVDDYSGIDNAIRYVAVFKKSVPREKLSEIALAWAIANKSHTPYALHVTHRIVKNDLEVADKTDFAFETVPDLFERWVKYRIQLEKDMQTKRIEILDRQIYQTNLFLRTISYIDRIVAIIKKEQQPAEKIAKLMKISLEDANTVLDTTLRRLTTLSKTQLTATLKRLEGERKTAIAIRKNPNARIIDHMKLIAKSID